MTHEAIPLIPVESAQPAGVLSKLLEQRRSTRNFGPRAISSATLAALAWAAQGRIHTGRRVTPSAHALYPLTLTVVAGNIEGIPAGAYRYDPDAHILVLVAAGDHRAAVSDTSFVDSEWLGGAAALLLLSGDLQTANESFADQTPKGTRGQRYVWLEAGHASQNVYLQAAESNVGAALVAGFDDQQLLDLSPAIVPVGHHPLALLAVGQIDPT